MKIKDRPEFNTKQQPLTATKDTPIETIVGDMVDRSYGSVIIVDDHDKVIGVVTERDIMKRLVHENKNPKTTFAADIMTENPRVANADDNILDWLRIMSNERFRRVPVVDADHRLISVMTQGDFVSYTWPDLIYQAKNMAKSTISANYQIMIIAAGISVYSLALTYLIN